MEGARRQAEGVRAFALYLWEDRASEELHRDTAGKAGEIECDVLSEAGEIGHHQDPLVLPGADEGQHLAVLGEQELDLPAPEGLMLLTQGDQALHPP
jgi:hypothetical protein